MFTFCPLQGALSESPASQYLLELDGGVKVLVGLGWDESFDPAKLKELERQVQSQSISLILLTHATVGHLAAFAHCCKNFPRFTHIPVYATRPVADLGRALIQDLYDSTPLAVTTIPEASLSEAAFAYHQKSAAALDLLLHTPSTDELARYFSLIQPLKYSQPHQPLPTPGTPPLNGLTITAYNSGRTLGGTIWHIQHGLESIVYAVDWNQARENVFSGAAWLGGAGGGVGEVIEQLRKPTALICSSRGAEKSTQAGGRAKRDEQLLEMIKVCVSRGGTALIPVDSSARVLELAYLLEHAWRNNKRNNGALAAAKVYLAGRNMSSTIRYARTMIEWMDDNINREFEAAQDNQKRTNGDDRQMKEGGPFDFKYVKILERKAQIQKLMAQGSDNVQTAGRVILASDTSLEWGFSKELLMGLAKDSRNMLVLTEKPGALTDRPSLAGTMWSWWKERRDGVSTEQGESGDDLEFVYAGGRELDVEEVTRQALEGDELTLYQHWLAQRQLQENVQGGGAAMEASANVVDDASESSSESDESDGEQQGKALNISATMGQRKAAVKDEDLGVNILTKKRKIYDFDVEGRKGRDRMFPVTIRRKKNDDFGDMIRPEEYLRAEEKAGVDEQEGQSGEDGAKLGKKRKWGDTARSPNKRPNLGRAVSDEGHKTEEIDELDEVEDDDPEVLGPSRLVRKVTRLMVNLRITFVDFSGIHDKRSLNMLIPLIQPRKLILVAGSRDETMALAADCKKLLAPHQKEGEDFVFTPSVGETVDASVDTNAWTIRLSDRLVKALKWQNVRGLGVVTITGQLDGHAEDEDKEHDEGANKRQKTDAEDAKPEPSAEAPSDVPTLDALAATPLAIRPHAYTQPLHVGDLRLADLRRAMQAAGYSAEFRGEGTLLVDGAVTVRKTATGRIEVSGVALGGGVPGVPGAGDIAAAVRQRGTLYEVRRVIYENLAVVGA